MNIQRLRAIVCGIGLMAMPVLHAQESSSTPAPEETPTGLKRFSFGFRVAGYPFNPMHNKDQNFTTTQTIPATYTISTINNYLKVGFGPSVEFAITRRFSLVGELFYHRLDYTETTQISQGTTNTGITENTRTTFWDAPLLVRFHGLRDEGVLAHIYFNAGGAFRDATNIKSNIVTNNPNGTTTTSNTPVKPSATGLAGAVVGSGLRFVDDFGIKVEPELRYTRWFGRTFASDSTRSSENQIEVSLAFTF